MAAFPHRIIGAVTERITGSLEFRCGDTCFISSLAREHRRLMQKGVVIDLLDEEIRHVGPRDETAGPVARIDYRAIGFRPWPAGQDHGTHDHPVELAPADDAFLYVLVVIGAPQQQMESHAVKKPATAATVARPEACYADQTLDSSLLHRGDEHLGRFG